MCTAQVSWPSGPAAGAAPGQASRQRSDARTMSAVGAKARRAMRASFGIEGIQDRNGGPIIPTALMVLASLLCLLAWPGAAPAAGPEGQLTWAVHISLAPTWFDPAEAPGMISPYMVLYALHD